jgi:hypothetical protein
MSAFVNLMNRFVILTNAVSQYGRNFDERGRYFDEPFVIFTNAVSQYGRNFDERGRYFDEPVRHFNERVRHFVPCNCFTDSVRVFTMKESVSAESFGFTPFLDPVQVL